MVIAVLWLSKKISSPWLAAGIGVILIGLGINGLASDNMPEVVAILIIVAGVINTLRLLPQPAENRD